MAIQKRSVINSGKPGEAKPSSGANALKVNPFTAESMKKKKRMPGFTVKTLKKSKFRFTSSGGDRPSESIS